MKNPEGWVAERILAFTEWWDTSGKYHRPVGVSREESLAWAAWKAAWGVVPASPARNQLQKPEPQHMAWLAENLHHLPGNSSTVVRFHHLVTNEAVEVVCMSVGAYYSTGGGPDIYGDLDCIASELSSRPLQLVGFFSAPSDQG